MAVSKVGETLPGIEASGDLSADQFKFVTINSSGQAVLAGAGAVIVGVLQNKPSAQGDAATIWGPGTLSKVVAAAAIAKGEEVTPDANGRAVVSSTGDYIVGQCTEAASALGELISVFITQPGRTPV